MGGKGREGVLCGTGREGEGGVHPAVPLRKGLLGGCRGTEGNGGLAAGPPREEEEGEGLKRREETNDPSMPRGKEKKS